MGKLIRALKWFFCLMLSVRSLQSIFAKKIFIRDERKKYHVMKFNASLNIDFSKWTQVRATACLRQDPNVNVHLLIRPGW